MTNAPDRTQIPDVSFSYTIRPAKEGELGVGDVYPSPVDDDFFTVRIHSGVLPDKKASMPFSKIRFRPNAQYWPELTTLMDMPERNLQYYDPEADFISSNDRTYRVMHYIFNNCWGEIRTSLRNALYYVDTPSESSQPHEAAPVATAWLKNMLPSIAYFSSDWPPSSPKIVEREDGYFTYDFSEAHTFQSKKDLRSEPWPLDLIQKYDFVAQVESTFQAYAIRAPYLTRKTVEAITGELVSIARPLFSPEEYDAFCEMIPPEVQALQDQDPTLNGPGTAVYRYVLTEDQVPEGFEENTQQLIVDYKMSVMGAHQVLIFESPEAAKAYYAAEAKSFSAEVFLLSSRLKCRTLRLRMRIRSSLSLRLLTSRTIPMTRTIRVRIQIDPTTPTIRAMIQTDPTTPMTRVMIQTDPRIQMTPTIRVETRTSRPSPRSVVIRVCQKLPI
ncbi:hypothetical protein K6V98_01715 [Collinsella sp. AGMB00827]|uniref:Uncharacterized protein n=1 Tax=Collinsella ureilytica TaxID=2869515 RepID=A0ABS7MI86_9ACTN|nr:hypothetical protein [Collinsella urealyticum]MBY4797081.1 hypothetical protein [Collinsella urealyticum]